jgi:hypothetical protein
MIDQRSQKENIIGELRKTPIIKTACEKAGIGRATFYRWLEEDEKFKRDIESALRDGRLLTNDTAESKLLEAIEAGNMTALIYWLKNNDERYREKRQISGSIEQKISRELTQEEKKMIERAVVMGMPQDEMGKSSKSDDEADANGHGK